MRPSLQRPLERDKSESMFRVDEVGGGRLARILISCERPKGTFSPSISVPL
jgi:hypothetical protein